MMASSTIPWRLAIRSWMSTATVNETMSEPFIDLNGNKIYERLATACDPALAYGQRRIGTLAEPITFDYTNGQAVPIHPAVGTAQGGVRNLASQGRQLYARQLYCLMLLLVDENYIAPWDEKDPQINRYLDTTIANSMAKNIRAELGPVPDPTPSTNQFDQKARAILLRKLTCRTIAQWAINCVDMRDADAIMTPFEYDENPWDGWGVGTNFDPNTCKRHAHSARWRPGDQ